MNASGLTPPRITRRGLLAGLTGAAVGALAAEERPTRPETQPLTFAVLGDTHFDRIDDHDAAWLQKEHPADVSQVRHYSQHTAGLLPALLAAVRQRLQGASLVLHVGDLVEGLCGSARLAARQCAAAISFLERAELNVPFLLTKGNHDVTGPGAAEAYQRVLLPYLGAQAGQKLTSPRYAVERQGCLFVLYDSYDRKSLPWLREVLGGTRARHVFVVVHQPVVPFQARANWSVLIRPGQERERAELLGLLSRHRAIVLVGHVHRYGVVVRQTEQGRFLQLALCSILTAKDEKPRQVLDGTTRYGPDLVELEPRFQPASRAERRKLLEREAPAVRHFEYAHTAGYALVRVEGGRVTADVHAGATQRPWKTLDLTGLLQA